MTAIDPKALEPGTRLRSLEDGRVVKLKARKEDDSGWWLVRGHGGLSDAVIAGGRHYEVLPAEFLVEHHRGPA